MSDFPSIDDLMSDQPSDASSKPPASLHVATDDKEKQLKEKMSDIDIKEREQETVQKATSLGYPHIELLKFPVSHRALKAVPRDQAEVLKTVCFFLSQEQARVGAVDPTNPDVQQLVRELEATYRVKSTLYGISEHSFRHVLSLYDKLPIIMPISKDVDIDANTLEAVQGDIQNFHTFEEKLSQAPVTDVITYVFAGALALNASDVHVEAEEEKVVIRFRIDGVLYDAAELPKDVFAKLISRIKLVASLKINVTNQPQDGRFSIKKPGGDVDVRVSTIPTVFGESVVMRLLVQGKEGISFDQLGLRGEAYSLLMEQIKRPNGMIVTTGPTGSGKTTTLYAAMQELNKPGVKIVSLEDPVEYRIEGVNQSQIDLSKNYTFSTGLKSILRQDPDIAMVGEIRDLETANIAIQAALTGHLMMSTIHTNSASGAIPRFLSMGVKPFLLGPALNAVMGQRLVRKLNPALKQKVVLSDEEQARVDAILDSLPAHVKEEIKDTPREFYTAPERDEQGNLGYTGRIGIYEMFLVDEDIEEMVIVGNISEHTIQNAAIAKGMITMVQDGVLKALDGITSLDEVFRVIE
jgi:type IV pilus assembly protein PilB